MTTTAQSMNGTQYDVIRTAVTYQGGMVNSYGDRRTIKALVNRGWVVASDTPSAQGFDFKITRDGVDAAMAFIMTCPGARDCEMIRFLTALTKVGYYAEMYGKIV